MKTILFDLDGTLLDTLEDLKNAVNHALISLNFPERSKEYVRLAIGNGTTVLMQRCCPEGTPVELQQEALKRFKDYYFHHYKDNTLPYEGIKEFLLGLKKDYTLGVISNKDDVFTKDLIILLLPDIFTVVQGSYVDHPRKPDPYLVNKVFNELGIKADEALYVGDTNVDYETARNSGMRVVLVHYGYRTLSELKKQCPEADIVDSYKELKDKIKLILG